MDDGSFERKKMRQSKITLNLKFCFIIVSTKKQNDAAN